MPGTGVDKHGRLRALAGGRVQGVSYRYFVWTHAQRLGVVGWVRNLPDGMTVEVVTEGPRAALEALLVSLRQGPPGAHVEQVEVRWEGAIGEFGSFEAR